MKSRLFARISAAAIVVASAAMLIAQALGFPAVPPSLPPWAALAFLLTGCVLWLEDRQPGRHLILLGIGSVSVLLIGIMVWSEYVLNTNFGFDRLLFPRTLMSTAHHPGRPAPLTGFHFCLLGIALLLLRTERKTSVLVREFCALTAITLSYFAFLRYMRSFEFGASLVPGTMTASAALLALLAAGSALALGAGGRLIPLLRDSGPAGLIARRLMPVPLLLPVAGTAIRLALRRVGLYDGESGAAIFASLDLLAAIAIVWVGAQKVLSVDLQRRQAEQELRQSHDELDRRVHLRTRELTEAQVELQRSNAILGSLIEACPLAICAFNLDGSVRKSNAAAEALDLSRNEACRQLAARAGHGELISGIEVASAGDGENIQLNVWASPILSPDARPEGVVVMAADITERKALDRQVQQTQKLESLGVLAGGIAHDFNNLLTGVLGHASLLREKLTGLEGAESAQAMLEAGQAMARLTAQMLAYSGRGRFELAVLDLSSQVRQIIGLIRASIPANVLLRLSLAEGLAPIEADAGQLQQVLMNLILNASEAVGAAQGTVEVSTCLCRATAEELQAAVTHQSVPAGDYVAVVVRDTGIGMDEQTKARIFDPFFTTKFAGRGLGLSAVLGIVRAHRGAMLVESQPGCGSTFRVFFPVPERKAISVQPLPAGVSHGQGAVLVVDDEPAVRNLAQMVLRKGGYKTLAAANGQEALAVWESAPDRIDIVLLDMTMPVMSGEETLRRLLARWPDAVVVATSGYAESEAAERLGNCAAGFIQKPYTAAELTGKIAAVLAKSRNARATVD